MENLISLHKEFVYNEKDYTLIYYNERYNCFCFYCSDNYYDFSDGATSVLISKEYGFIKWLVENDKIDLGEKLFNLTKNDNRKSIICDLDNNDFSWEDTFLMLLSISDTPLEFLSSCLK